MSQDKPSEREEIEMLLPWFITRRLDAADMKRVESMLARDGELRRQLELIREEQSATVTANERVAAPRTLSVERGMAAVASKTTLGVRRTGTGLVERIREFFTMPSPRAVRVASAAALAILLLQTATIGSLIFQREAYTTASGSSTAGSTVIVKFVDGASAQTIASTLSQLNVTIVDGPKPGGTFVVRIGPQSLSKAERDTKIDALRKASGVIGVVLAQQ